MHDFNGGILPSGLFWTLDLHKSAIDFKMSDRRAVLHVRRLPVIYTCQFFGQVTRQVLSTSTWSGRR